MNAFLGHLQQAAAGEDERAPGADRVVEVVGALDGPCDAVTFLSGRIVVAADVDQAWATEALAPLTQVRPEDRTRALSGFVSAMVEQLGGPSAYVGVLAVAPRRAALLRGEFTPANEPDRAWAPYRRDISSHHFDSRGVVGAVHIGRGPGGRWDTVVRVDGDARGGGGDSRQLLAAALTLVPRGEDLYVSAPVHDIRTLRTVLAGGFRPLGTEILFLTRPQAGGTRSAGAPGGPVASGQRTGAARSTSRSGGSGGAREERPGFFSRLFGGGKR